MSERTEISWCDSTINFWRGCTKVSPGCANCYAESLTMNRMGGGKYVRGIPRVKFTGAIKSALAMNRKWWVCEKCGEFRNCAVCQNCHAGFGSAHRRRIFTNSLSDWLDDEVPIEWLADMLDAVRQCDKVTWILCTKRPENWDNRTGQIMEGICEDGAELRHWMHVWRLGNPPPNIILLASVENQAMADKRIPELLKIPAACRGLSLEPLLGEVSLRWLKVFENGMATKPFPQSTNHYDGLRKLDWLIVGAESGPKRRYCQIDWIGSLVEQGKASGVSTFVKQVQDADGSLIKDVAEFPPEMQLQQWPKGF